MGKGIHISSSFSPPFNLIYLVHEHQVVAETQIKQDDNLVLNYGCLNNDFFLLDYGFVIPSNPYDCIELKYDGALLDAASMAAGVMSPNFSSPAPWQQQILSKLNLDGEAPVLKVSASPSLVEFSRVEYHYSYFLFRLTIA